MSVLTASLLMILLLGPSAAASEKVRLVVMSDIGADPDDQQSLIRLLVYSNELAVEGLIASSRLFNGGEPRPELIRAAVRAYGAVHANLSRHAENYPEVSELLSVVKTGTSTAGLESVKQKERSEASAHIISVVDQLDPRPVWVLIWGGATDLALALSEVKNSRSREDMLLFLSKLKVYAIGDQDKTVSYLKSHFPTLFLINPHTTSAPRFTGLTRGMYHNEVGGAPLVKDFSLVSAAWAEQYVVTQHGPLGALYPLNAIQTPRASKGVKEGDTPSMLYLLSAALGLSDPLNPSWGSWGGRFTKIGRRTQHFASAADNHWSGSKDRNLREEWTVARFRRQYQNDFHARMEWCEKSFAEANHRPVPVIGNDSSPKVLSLSVPSGGVVRLDTSASYDPDGDTLHRVWYFYEEAGTYGRKVRLRGRHSAVVEFTAPRVEKPKTLHLIFEISDGGSPPLRAYRRVIIQLLPG